MERTDSGVLTVTMHTNGGSHIHTGKAHHEFPEAFGEIARDRHNEIVIFTGAGEYWMSHIDFSTVDDITKPAGWYAILTEARQLLYNFLDISVPVISVVNGGAPIHGEYALMADIILAAEDAYFQDNQHLSVGGGVVPADGVQILYPAAMGDVRGHYFLLTMQKLAAKEALQIGMVNEVHSREKLLARVNELAEQLLRLDPFTRRYTRLMFTRKLKRRVIDELSFDMGLEGLSILSSVQPKES
ncbi:MAG: enoyl-CoA hydratase/isomerase family protein [Xenococcaceae cyanobacterium]